MFGTLLAREIRRLASSPVQWGLLLLLAAAAAWAVGSGLEWRETKLAEQTLVPGEMSERPEEWMGALEKAEAGESISPFQAQPMALGFPAILPPGPLGDFSFGRDALYPHYAIVQGWRNSASLFRRYEVEGPTTLATGRLDLTFVVVVLLPLVLILLGFDSLSAERENKRLPLLLVQGVRPGSIVAARLSVAATATWAIVAIAAGVGLLLADAPERVARFAVWWSAMTAYCLFWVAIVALVAASFRRQTNAALAALGAWIGLVVVIPSGVQFATAALHPPPSQVELLTSARRAEAEARQHIEERAEIYMAEHPSDEAPAEGVPGFYRAAYLANLDVEERTAPLLDAFEESHAAQDRLADSLQLFSPVMVAHDILTSVSGAGFGRTAAFQQQVRRHLQILLDAIGPATVGQRRLSVAEARAIPAFEYSEPAIPQGTWRWIGLLLGWTAVASVLAMRRLAGVRKNPL